MLFAGMRFRPLPRLLLVGFALATVTIASAAARPPSAAVAIIRSVEWSPGDVARDGAGEFAVYLQVAQLQRANGAAGVVAIGDKNGRLRDGSEQALRRLVHTGVPVVKLSSSGHRAATDHILFLDGGVLAPDSASDILAASLQRHGPPPCAANAKAPTPAELAAIQAHLQPFQAALTSASATSVGTTTLAQR